MDREVAEHEIIDRLFFFWDVSCRGSLSLQVFALKSIKLPGRWQGEEEGYVNHGSSLTLVVVRLTRLPI